MANSMKRPPMQKQAERLAEQGRFGDSMLVHMNPAEVEGIASLMPGGQLTINPQTGQPEAFIGALIALGSAVAGGIKGRKDRKAAQRQTDAIAAKSAPFDKFTADQLNRIASGQSSAFSPGKSYEDYDDKSQIGFLPKGTSPGINFDFQNTPGTMYANYQPDNPFAMEALPKRITQQPVTQDPIDTDETGGTVATIPADDVGGMAPDFDSLELINESRRLQGLPPFESIEDFYDFVSDQHEGGPDSWLGPMVANEGGLASLPVYMNIGGIAPRSAFQRSGDRRSLSSRVPGMRRMAMRSLKPTSLESGDAQAIPLDQDVVQEIAVGEESIQEAADKLAKTGMPLSKRLERQMKRADRREARRQRKADRIAARNDPGGYEQVVSKFAPKQPTRPTDTSADTSAETTQPQPQRQNIFQRGRDRIQERRENIRNQAEATAAANAYARSMGVTPERGGFGSRIRNFDQSADAWLQRTMPFIGNAMRTQERGDENRGLGGLFLDAIGFADGDMVEHFPRMNGPISGPGTERSDDIPAMLSDGEFVVNARAVRGVGKLNGANGSKSDQRREGARMMYALQNAGEQAMRRT
jgi:hypothetical protein